MSDIRQAEERARETCRFHERGLALGCEPCADAKAAHQHAEDYLSLAALARRLAKELEFISKAHEPLKGSECVPGYWCPHCDAEPVLAEASAFGLLERVERKPGERQEPPMEHPIDCACVMCDPCQVRAEQQLRGLEENDGKEVAGAKRT